MDEGTDNGQMNRHTDNQLDTIIPRHTDNKCDTIIPRHYCVAGYKKTM